MIFDASHIVRILAETDEPGNLNGMAGRRALSDCPPFRSKTRLFNGLSGVCEDLLITRLLRSAFNRNVSLRTA